MSYVHNKNAKFINSINPHSLNTGKNLKILAFQQCHYLLMVINIKYSSSIMVVKGQ